MSACWRCGTDTSSTATFCAACGADLKSGLLDIELEADPTGTGGTDPQQPPTRWIIVGVVAVVVGLIAFFALAGGLGGDDPPTIDPIDDEGGVGAPESPTIDGIPPDGRITDRLARRGT